MYGTLPKTGLSMAVVGGAALTGSAMILIGVVLVLIGAGSVRLLWRRGRTVTSR